MSVRRVGARLPMPRSLAALGMSLFVAWCFCRYLAPDTLLALLTSLSFCN